MSKITHDFWLCASFENDKNSKTVLAARQMDKTQVVNL
jgi:hypothetical protein